MSIIPQKKGNRKSEESNFYSPVLLSKNLYPDIVRMERVEICWRYIHILKIASSGYNAILLTVAKFFGFLILTFPSPISAKKTADTICCGPPFAFRIEDISIYPKEIISFIF